MKRSEIPDILRKIIASKKDEIDDCRSKIREFRTRAESILPPRDFKSALRKKGGSIIAEVKKASPSKGIICQNFNHLEISRTYEESGADALSVLTEKNYFLGEISYLQDISARVSIPVLRKDFIVSEAQIYESRACGADSFLLIAAVLDKVQLAEFVAVGRSLLMEALVEVHSEYETEAALESGASIIGVNNRDLRTFKVDLGTGLRLAGEIPPGKVKVAESGIGSPEDLKLLKNAGYDAFLIGEAFMKAGSTGEAESLSDTIKSFRTRLSI